ncbi:MAG TPA: 4Fe-4S dicluster domain-containing protein [Rhodocyclaceae bacterium]|nr:4Fe-4S dicluster domain-containing protein [Rhodocyclaceae bacterium]
MVTRRQFLRGILSERKPEAAASDAHAEPWLLVARISESCLAHGGTVCRVCADVCVPAAIRFRPRLGASAVPEVDVQKCSGCGACVVPCPAQAITLAHPDAAPR